MSCWSVRGRCIRGWVDGWERDVTSGPMEVLNIRLKAKGKVRGLPVVGEVMPYF